MSMEQWWKDTDRGNWSTGRKNCSSAAFSITNLVWTDMESNPNSAARERLITLWAVARLLFAVSCYDKQAVEETLFRL